jgi:hypothetical protein
MNDLLLTCSLPSCADSPNVISSPASECGVTLCAAPDGPMTDLFGRVLAPASPLAPPAKAMSSQMSVTYGRHGSGSSASAALTLSLANRYQARTRSLGSTMFDLTWKQRLTPSGFSIPACRASAVRTSGNDFISSAPWITPQTHDDKERGNTMADNHYSTHDLSNQSQLATWPTPRTPTGGAESAERKQELGRTESGGGDLQAVAQMAVSSLASWATPSARDWRSNEASEEHHALRAEQTRGKPLNEQAHQLATVSGPTPNGLPAGMGSHAQPGAGSVLSSWPTPCAQPANGTPEAFLKRKRDSMARGSQSMGVCLSDIAMVAQMASWPTPMAGTPAQNGYNEAGNTDSSRKTVALMGGGQLNPALPRWLQGLPPEWDIAAIKAHRSIRTKRRKQE